MADNSPAIERVFRSERGRILAALIPACGSFDLAEDALQEAFSAACSHWERDGVPANPGAWLTSVARRKLIDAARRARTRREQEEPLAYEATRTAGAGSTLDTDDEMDYPDERLKLLFTCCHPALHREAQVALTLRTLCGLTTSEIAHAFLVSEATLAQRLVRAKAKIREACIPYQVPPPHRLAERVASVRAVLYLVFNEGYAASAGESLVRGELCGEAIRLARMLDNLMPGAAENLALLALMILQDSRRAARTSAGGELVVLDEQDRSLWDAAAIAEGLALTHSALRTGPAGPYQIQAAIAAVIAESLDNTPIDWSQVAALYERLGEWTRSPVVALNHAVAIALGYSLEEGLRKIDSLAADGLAGYHYFHAARADLLRRLGRSAEALASYKRARQLAGNAVERGYLDRRIEQLRGHGSTRP